jgi:hypothetical protein
VNAGAFRDGGYVVATLGPWGLSATLEYL